MKTNIPMSNYMVMLPSFHMFPSKFSGGSFVVPFEIDSTIFNITVDTGAPGPICIGLQGVKKLSRAFAEKAKC